jgi:hypothetical protein
MNLGTRHGNSADVVDHINLGHTDTSIADVKDLVLLVGCDTDVEFLLSVELRWIR